jgi:hypothetical protein
MQDGAKQLSGIPCPLPIRIWALWLAALATSLQVAFGGVAQAGQAFERWNLPIAGVAVQINRVQYFSLSALVREGRPMFVIGTQCSAHIRLGRRAEYLACSQCALGFHDTPRCVVERRDHGLVVLSAVWYQVHVFNRLSTQLVTFIPSRSVPSPVFFAPFESTRSPCCRSSLL